jgi:AcrR family transcriptional regulator
VSIPSGALMTRTAERTRRRILGAAYELFYRTGFTRVSVDAIAAAARVTKRTLYHYFTSKDELLARALALQHELALERIEAWSNDLEGELDTVIDTLFADLGRWARKPRWGAAGFTRLVMELADLPGHPARAVARHHKAEIAAVLTRLLAERGVTYPAKRAEELMLLLEGAMVLCLIRGDTSPIATAAAAAKRLIGARPTRHGELQNVRTARSLLRDPDRPPPKASA